jgi:hypothetical protein
MVVGLEVGRVRGIISKPFPKETECALCFVESLSPRLRERKEDFGVGCMWSRRAWVVDARTRTGAEVSVAGDVGFIVIDLWGKRRRRGRQRCGDGAAAAAAAAAASLVAVSTGEGVSTE